MAVPVFLRTRQSSTAVEFALVAPVLLLMLFGLVGVGVVLSTANGLQQLAAESARASVAGLSDTERAQIAQGFVVAHVGAYPFLDTRQLTVTTAAAAAPNASFQVSLDYDLSRGIVGQLATLLPMLPARIKRSAVVLISSGL